MCGEESLRSRRSRDVDEAVGGGGGPARHEPLLELVADRVAAGDGNGDARGAKAPAPVTAERAVEKDAQDQVLGEVRELPDALVHGAQLRRGGVGKEGREDRQDDPGGALAGEPAAR